MWRRNVFVALIALLFVLASAKGSCLEYGHSCWGAHGKRSGGAVYRGAADHAHVPASNQNRIVAPDTDLVENLPEVERDKNGRVPSVKYHDEPIKHHATKSRSLLRKRHSDRMARQNYAGAELPAYQKWMRNYVQQQQQREQPAEASDLYQQHGRGVASMRKDMNHVYFNYK